jgi:sorting nexin-1/2
VDLFVDFVEKRRASLERYLNRTASHQNLRVDPDFRYFIQSVFDTVQTKNNIKPKQ